MTKQTIEVEGLPEGYRGVSINIPTYGQSYWNGHNVCVAGTPTPGYAYLIVKKIQPRKIVLEETDELRRVKRNEYYFDRKGNIAFWSSKGESIEKYNIVREVKKTDIPLNNE